MKTNKLEIFLLFWKIKGLILRKDDGERRDYSDSAKKCRSLLRGMMDFNSRYTGALDNDFQFYIGTSPLDKCVKSFRN